MPKKLTYEYVKLFIEEQKYRLISTEYIGIKTKLLIKCFNNHEFLMSFEHFKRGQRCPICSHETKNKKQFLSDKVVTEEIKFYNYKKHSKYISCHHKIELECPVGHIFKISWNNFKNGRRCPICANKKRKNQPHKLKYEEVKRYIENHKYNLLNKEYKNNCTKLKLQCPKNHEFLMSFEHFKRGQRCPICYYNSTSSKPEKEVQKFVSDIYNGSIINNDRNTIINPLTGHNLELDVYLPEINKAIEFNGSYWHSLPNCNDKVKSEQCRNNNIQLLIIHEENWMDNKEMCLQVIEEFIKI